MGGGADIMIGKANSYFEIMYFILDLGLIKMIEISKSFKMDYP